MAQRRDSGKELLGVSGSHSSKNNDKCFDFNLLTSSNQRRNLKRFDPSEKWLDPTSSRVCSCPTTTWWIRQHLNKLDLLTSLPGRQQLASSWTFRT